MKFQHVFLDMDDTLFDFKKAEEYAFKHALQVFNIPYRNGMYKQYTDINAMQWKQFECGKITRLQMQYRRFAAFFLAFQIDGIDVSAFNKCYLDGLGNSAFLIDGAEMLCKTLSKSCRLYIASNGMERNQKKRLVKSGLSQYITKLFISEVIGFQKPQKEFFTYMFDNLHITDLSQCILLGDSLSADIAGGKNAGIRTCLYAKNDIAGEYDYKISRLPDFIKIVMQ